MTDSNKSPRVNEGWITDIAASKYGSFTNEGWFDIPNGWVTDAPGMVVMQAGSASGWGNDYELHVGGSRVYAMHQVTDWGGIGSCICPKGVTINASASNGVLSLKYMRMNA